MKYEKNTYMQFYIAIGIAGIEPYKAMSVTGHCEIN